MNTKFTILVAAGLLFAGVSQAEGTHEFNNKPHHEVVARHEVRKEFKKAPHHKMHHKVKRHHRKMRHGKPGRH